MNSHPVIIENAVKRYGDFAAVNGISLRVEAGEFFTLLGPSGCGKTTLLRMIAGFNSVDEGTISFAGQIINAVPAHKRDIGMVFQNYAIFPHLSVAENVAYGLKARKVPAAERAKRVTAALELVQIAHLRDRKPNELSGGQQQRVALARAFVIEPKVLLMDEPLSNLDAKLRVQMRSIIKKLQRRLGITTLYVTHDQEEALAISDRIAVMKDGKLMQVGTPEAIYRKPENPFVAGFIGISNFLPCEVTGDDPQNATVTLKDGARFQATLTRAYSGTASLSVRPEQFIISTGNDGLIPDCEVVLETFLGDFTNYEIKLPNGQLVEVNEYTKDSSAIHKQGTRMSLSLGAGYALFDRDERALT